ncbi:MAG: DNA gyrase subunit A [Rhodospirillales bacterium]
MTDPTDAIPGDIAPITIEEEMKRSYLDYAMSVIVARALPDVRDGLKPVHRRILYAMNEAGYDWTRPFRKSARVVGDVMGKYHPHGDAAIYDALVRMAQDFSMRLPLIEGQGNFGSMDGDPPAAMRYTEARLHRAAAPLLADIDKETVDFQATYDEQTVEPVVLPAQFPNLLVNGANGIAVGMATNIPPHNLGEVVAACMAYLDDPAIGDDRLIEMIPGPDFPTGGIVLGRRGLREAYIGGRGSVVVRGRTHIEDIRKDRQAIVDDEIPYQVNKLRLIERIAECVQEKLIDGISDLRDESDRDGVRVVVELKRDASPDIVLNQLYRYTALQTSFGFNMLALNGGRPELMGLRGILSAFCGFREQVIARRTRHELRKARDRAHVVIGLALAVVNLDPVIALIRSAPDPVAARDGLMARDWPVGDIGPFIALVDEPGRGIVDGTYRLTEAQARAILELRLQRLTGLERDKLLQELRDLTAQIADLVDILGSRPRVLAIMREELQRIADEFGTPRRTALEDSDADTDIEDLIQSEDMVVTVTHRSYIKRVPLSAYRAQRRGGKGRSGMATREEDFVTRLFVANTHQPILFFTSRGMAYRLKCYQLPLGTPQARGRPIVQLLPALPPGEEIAAVMPLPQDEATWSRLHVMFATSAGNVRRNALSDFLIVRANGKIAMKLAEEGETLIGVLPCSDDDDVLLATRGGKCIRFAIDEVRLFVGRSSTGVRGIKLADGDSVISMSMLRHAAFDVAERDAYLRIARRRRGIDEAEPADLPAGEGGEAQEVQLSETRIAEYARDEQFVLAVTANGFGKRSSAYEYRITGRGGQGYASIETSERNGQVLASFPVAHGDQIMLATDRGQVLRIPVDEIRIAGRKTQGVVLFRVADGESVVAASRLGDEADETEGGDKPAGM